MPDGWIGSSPSVTPAAEARSWSRANPSATRIRAARNNAEHVGADLGRGIDQGEIPLGGRDVRDGEVAGAVERGDRKAVIVEAFSQAAGAHFRERRARDADGCEPGARGGLCELGKRDRSVAQVAIYRKRTHQAVSFCR
jgi:hypothetical protein